MNNSETRTDKIERQRQETIHTFLEWLAREKLIQPDESVNIVLLVTITPRSAEKFGERGHQYYSRQLTPDELDVITALPWLNWQRALVDQLVKDKNTPIPAQTIVELTAAGRRKRAWMPGILAQFNQIPIKSNKPFRLRAQPDQSTQDEACTFRFFHKV